MNAPDTGTQASLDALRSDRWQRLAPAAIIHFMVKFVLGVAKNGIQNVAYLGGIAVFTGDNRWIILGSIAAGALVILIAAGILSYINFRFRLEGQTFLIRRGVFNKKRLTLSFDRIQNVAIKEPLYFRPFGLVALALESAGSSSEEVSLAGIPRPLAASIRQSVLARPAAPHLAETGSDDQQEEAEATDSGMLLLAQPTSELARYGLSNNNIWVVAGAAMGLLFQQADQWEPEAEAFVSDTIIPVIGSDPLILGMLFAGGVLAIALTLMLFSVIGAIIIYHGYRLSYGDGRYHRTKGFFERQETSLPESKIQSLQISQPWPALLLKRWHLTLKQVGFASQDNINAGKQASFLVPSVTSDFYKGLVDRIFGATDWSTVTFRKISRLFIWKTLTYYFLLPAAAIAAIVTAKSGAQGLYVLLLPVLTLPFVMLRHRRFGYWSNGATAILRRGFVGSRQTAFSFRKVQTVSMTQSPSQRRRKLATLRIQLAGQTITVPYMPLEDASAWRDRILFEVETTHEPWM